MYGGVAVPANDRDRVREYAYDPSESRFRTQMVAANVWLTYVICAALGVWLALTPHRPHRAVLAGVLAGSVAVAVVIARLPTERIVRGRWREAFFLGWSAVEVAVVATIAAADGGATSPLNDLYFLVVAFAALSYPMAMVVTVAVLNIVAFAAVGLVVGGQSPRSDSAWIFELCLAATSGICVCQARIQRRLRQELARASRTDPLTGSLNRRGFDDVVDDEISRAADGSSGFALVVLDLDHFKEVNDRYGHGAGDELLCWAVERINDVIGPADAVARLGGDEFAVVLGQVGGVEAQRTAQRLRASLAERIGVTWGVACFPGDGAARDALQRHADAHLYAAKRARPSVLRSRPTTPRAALP
jgi:diguanylate cyclase (GGDEF)-like protein